VNGQSEKGNATLGFVLLLFALGILMLSGLQQQLNQQRYLVASEIGFLKQYAAAVSAQAWGSQLSWTSTPTWECQHQSHQGWNACILTVGKNEFLMAAYGNFPGQQSPVTLWLWGSLENSRWISTPHGWLDFCPLTDASRCQLPQ